ncbi:alpha/beta hydrolase [Ekhidna sp.]|uniref:alpha/beta hydrolase n=1 Tax=Ekhidna sp. TaxID=2608089 RepID=UPI0032F011D1
MSSLKVFVFILLAVYLFGGLALHLLQDQFIFLPERLDPDYQYSFDQNFEEYNLKMEDGAEINALHFTLPESKGLIVYFHGNAGNLARWGEIVNPFVEMGYEVFITDYRGYGKSTGKRSEKAMLKDADEIYTFAKTLEKEDRIILFGRSLGSAFASYITGKNQPQKLILETPFYSLLEVARGLFPIYPTPLLLSYRFPNHEYLNDAQIPIFIFHGTDDEVVPYESGIRLATEFEENSTFISIQGGHHNDLALFEDYWAEMENVLNDE